jgi:SAM-dependent methyltransferase
VLDPFCGSGTELVEAMLQGHDAVGVDLNPLAIALSTLKTEPHPRPDLDALALAAESVARFADQRRKARAGATQRYPEVDTQAFDAHVLLELDSLRHGIHTLGTEAQRSALMLVLSAILVKVSRKESDTATREQPKRIAAGYPARLFLKKAEELCGRLAELEALLPKPRPHATLELDDATRLTKLPSASVDTVVTSPPYVATYDYLAHHDLRLRWLDLDASRFETNELGARRDYAKLTASTARERWLRDLRSLLLTLGRVTRRGGAVVLLMADSAVDDQPLPAEEIVAEATGGTALACVARASQLRHHYHQATRAAFRERPRAEHALLLERT